MAALKATPSSAKEKKGQPQPGPSCSWVSLRTWRQMLALGRTVSFFSSFSDHPTHPAAQVTMQKSGKEWGQESGPWGRQAPGLSNRWRGSWLRWLLRMWVPFMFAFCKGEKKKDVHLSSVCSNHQHARKGWRILNSTGLKQLLFHNQWQHECLQDQEYPSISRISISRRFLCVRRSYFRGVAAIAKESCFCCRGIIGGG